MRPFFAAFVVVFALAGCEVPTELVPRPDAVRFTPRAIYADWFAEVRECSGIDGDFSRIRWFVVPGVEHWPSTHNGLNVAAEWWPAHDIYIAGLRIEHWSEKEIVKHEIGHDLIQDADPDHSDPIWDGCAPREV